MQIEAGKYYRTRDGRKVGPMEDYGWDDGEPWSAPDVVHCWGGSGKWDTMNPFDSPNDLIAEWSEPNTTTAWFLDAESSPVRTVTRRVIVPGLYGIVAVYREHGKTRVTLTREDGTPDQLEAAARTLQQLAEALREG